ncbi:hypothetical protein TRIUR3_34914 [Triticum urartu]|uniref:Uncharacterized protein n=1 Tax=Triticum urartu TaxID=4572 RepID=M7ZUF8_TRIUA|nr:hypothetical protein TRIUR3_34914 [Triticum urartu]
MCEIENDDTLGSYGKSHNIYVYKEGAGRLRCMPSPKSPNPSSVRFGPPFIRQRGCHSGTQEVESAWLVGLEAACCHASACLVDRLVATSERARGSEALASAGLASVPQTPLARALPGSCGRPCQGSCRVASIPVKGIAGGLRASPARALPGSSIVPGKILSGTLPSLGHDVVDSVVTLRLKGGGLAGVGQVAPPCIFAYYVLPSPAVGVAMTARGQVKGYRRAATFVHRQGKRRERKRKPWSLDLHAGPPPHAGRPPERRLRSNAGCRAGPQADALVVLDGDGPCVRAPAAWTKLRRGHELPSPNPGVGAYGSTVVDPARPRSAEATGSQAGHREDRTNEYGDPAVEDAEGQEHSGVVRLMGCPDGTVKIGDYMVWRHYCINGKSKVSKPLLSIQQHTAALRILPASLQLGRAHIVCGHMRNLCARRCPPLRFIARKMRSIPAPSISVSLVSSVTEDGWQSASFVLWKGEFLLKKRQASPASSDAL